MAETRIDADRLPRLLYIGDVSVSDTFAGEALLYRLLQFYPPEKLAIVCGVRDGMSRLPGVAYHHWGPMFPNLLRSRVAEEYVLWRAWRYYEIPATLARIATLFRAEAMLSISHVSGWLAAWQIAAERRLPLHMIVHDDFAYASRFPKWSRGWAERRFGEAYRFSSGRFCISDTMAERYRERFGADGAVMYPTHKGTREWTDIGPRVQGTHASLTFAYGGSLNSASDIEQVVTFARVAGERGHRLLAFTPQHAILSARAAAARVTIDVHPPIPPDELAVRFRNEADCVFLPQSMVGADLPSVATAFPTKWSDYSTLGLPMLVWAPTGSSSERFVLQHPGCAALVTTTKLDDLAAAIHRIQSDEAYRSGLASRLLELSRQVFAPAVAWQTFSRTIAAA